MENDNEIKWWKSRTQNIVAFTALILIFCVILLLMFFPIPQENKDIFNILIAMTFQPLIGAVTLYLFNYKRTDNNDPNASVTTITQTSQIVEPKTKKDDEQNN